MIDALDEIADQNNVYGNVGTRKHKGTKRGKGPRWKRIPKWRTQLRHHRTKVEKLK